MVRFVKCLQHKTISRRFSTIQLNLPKCKSTDNLIIVQSYIMNRKYKKLFIFLGKTLFYFVVILILLYLYSYSKTGGAHFIYNEF
ncbi:teichoic acid D-Ala incorporation-associated protein DltX [Lactococcus petauri]|uniref:teichoic acid D-Ala incorporation-associated protein DltX n=1 Tax=Lactococcus petauri TaxID=1940789 RepID=UPI0035BBFD7B